MSEAKPETKPKPIILTIEEVHRRNQQYKNLWAQNRQQCMEKNRRVAPRS